MPAQIIKDGSLAGQIPDIPVFKPVTDEVFAERAARLNVLAPGHSSEHYLQFASELCALQAEAQKSLPTLEVPDHSTLAHCRDHGLPPLSVEHHRRDYAWCEGLGYLTDRIDCDALPPEVARAIQRLDDASHGDLEAAASNLLGGVYSEVDPSEAPFIAAALQLYWVKMALQLAEQAPPPAVSNGLCPVCGSHPVASVVRIGGARQGLRYLVCSLCASEWHLVRVRCSSCGSTKGISYLGLDGGSEAVKAECCDECKSYLKVFYLEKDTSLVPAADDLATLALDMLVEQEGYNRVGPNLLLMPGAA
ncbi:MAG TPA: formate dehydrogenase accessory protein FdhE [Burkholderiales bacterium]|nr:formate dehydrogenase accessory protein FdhE [Burkholderiales bacterium]